MLLPLKLAGVVPSKAYTNLFAIIGEPNTGKTTAALTFPNPVVLDFDKKLPTNVQCVEFWNEAWVHNYLGTKPPVLAHKHTALLKWLRDKDGGMSLSADHTLILDSYTNVDASWEIFVARNQHMFQSVAGKFDAMKAYREKINYNIELFALLKSLDCAVVVTFHEQIERDKTTGYPTGKMKPLLSGQFKDQIMGHFGMAVRQLVNEDSNKKPIYQWQILSDKTFDAMTSPAYKFPSDVKFIGAQYNNLTQYKI